MLPVINHCRDIVTHTSAPLTHTAGVVLCCMPLTVSSALAAAARVLTHFGKAEGRPVPVTPAQKRRIRPATSSATAYDRTTPLSASAQTRTQGQLTAQSHQKQLQSAVKADGDAVKKQADAADSATADQNSNLHAQPVAPGAQIASKIQPILGKRRWACMHPYLSLLYCCRKLRRSELSLQAVFLRHYGLGGANTTPCFMSP